MIILLLKTKKIREFVSNSNRNESDTESLTFILFPFQDQDNGPKKMMGRKKATAVTAMVILFIEILE